MVVDGGYEDHNWESDFGDDLLPHCSPSWDARLRGRRISLLEVPVV